MKKITLTVCHNNPMVRTILIAALSFVRVGQVSAQTFRTLHTFNDNNNDGGYVYAGLTLSGNTMYGTARGGGSANSGTVFALNTDGTGFRTVYTFSQLSPEYDGTNADGANPSSSPLALSGNTLYGATDNGGPLAGGTLYAVNTDGTGFTTIYDFSPNPSGYNAGAGPLIISGAGLFGTASIGGSSNNGMVYNINTDGTGLTSLHDFSDTVGDTNGFPVNSDGLGPGTSLILSGNTLYGTMENGGSGGSGTVFAANIDGSDFRVLYTFSATPSSTPETNADGAAPSGLVLSGNILYGTAEYGGTGGNGTVFALNTDGTGFTNLYSFTASTGNWELGTNSDGALPTGLVLSGNTLYGTARLGGNGGNGTLFAIHTDGSGFTTLHSFGPPTNGNSNHDGEYPTGGLVFSGNELFGTTSFGGSWGDGTTFSISLSVTPPQLGIAAAGEDVVLSWPATFTGFTLQSTTNLGSTAVWTAVSPAQVIVNGQNTVTNPISGTQQFYRLSQ
jgi:uncharacterized repeat protein (TIGR03803 family)